MYRSNETRMTKPVDNKKQSAKMHSVTLDTVFKVVKPIGKSLPLTNTGILRARRVIKIPQSERAKPVSKIYVEV